MIVLDLEIRLPNRVYLCSIVSQNNHTRPCTPTHNGTTHVHTPTMQTERLRLSTQSSQHWQGSHAHKCQRSGLCFTCAVKPPSVSCSHLDPDCLPQQTPATHTRHTTHSTNGRRPCISNNPWLDAVQFWVPPERLYGKFSSCPKFNTARSPVQPSTSLIRACS